MSKKRFRKTFIRKWREDRDLSLRKLASMMEESPGVELISHASLGRIEKGEQPYSQPILEALAQALDVSIPMLLDVDPTKEGEVIDLVRRLTDEQRAQAVRIIKALCEVG